MLSKVPSQAPDVEDTARYIAGISKELKTMAANVELGFLTYLLAMVEEEADRTARRIVADRAKERACVSR